MKRINKTTVELTPDEMTVWDTFHGLLSDGHAIPRSAIAALTSHGKPWTRERYPDNFVAYLSEATVEWPNRAEPPRLSSWGRALAAKGMTHMRGCLCDQCRPDLRSKGDRK